MTPLYEIVPNLSEGRDSATIDAAAAAVERGGARLIDRSSDEVHHRSVLTDRRQRSAGRRSGGGARGRRAGAHRPAHPSRRSSAHRRARRPAFRSTSRGRPRRSRRPRPPCRGRDLAALLHSFLLLRRGSEAKRAAGFYPTFAAIGSGFPTRATFCATKAPEPLRSAPARFSLRSMSSSPPGI